MSQQTHTDSLKPPTPTADKTTARSNPEPLISSALKPLPYSRAQALQTLFTYNAGSPQGKKLGTLHNSLQGNIRGCKVPLSISHHETPIPKPSWAETLKPIPEELSPVSSLPRSPPLLTLIIWLVLSRNEGMRALLIPFKGLSRASFPHSLLRTRG